MTPSEYLNEIREALAEASREGDGAGPDAEALLAHLAARSLLVVEAPPGVHHDFRGIAP